MKGTLVGGCEGRRFNKETLLPRQWDSGRTYLFDGTTSEGGQGGCAIRRLDHAYAPNCEVREKKSGDGVLVLGIYTVRPVARDAELFINYALVIDDSETSSDCLCCCGHAACRGTMAAVQPVHGLDARDLSARNQFGRSQHPILRICFQHTENPCGEQSADLAMGVLLRRASTQGTSSEIRSGTSSCPSHEPVRILTCQTLLQSSKPR